jgi:hypothetical protein
MKYKYGATNDDVPRRTSLAAAGGVTYRRYRGIEEIPGMGAANARLRRHLGVLEPIDSTRWSIATPTS